MRPGTAPGRAAAAGVGSCTRQAIRVSRQWQLEGWQLAPANYATRNSSRAGRGRRGRELYTAGHPSQSSVATHWQGWQRVPANYATPGRDSARAGRGREVCQLQPAGHPSRQ